MSPEDAPANSNTSRDGTASVGLIALYGVARFRPHGVVERARALTP